MPDKVTKGTSEEVVEQKAGASANKPGEKGKEDSKATSLAININIGGSDDDDDIDEVEEFVPGKKRTPIEKNSAEGAKIGAKIGKQIAILGVTASLIAVSIVLLASIIATGPIGILAAICAGLIAGGIVSKATGEIGSRTGAAIGGTIGAAYGSVAPKSAEKEQTQEQQAEKENLVEKESKEQATASEAKAPLQAAANNNTKKLADGANIPNKGERINKATDKSIAK